MMIRSAGLLALTMLLLVTFSPVSAAKRAELQLASVNAAVAHAETGELVYGKNADRPVPIASITKLMTALVVMESGE
ncbi:MAG TPA: D-alanyl-D-alanine endopeptidase, partial [Marinobacter sp.]